MNFNRLIHIKSGIYQHYKGKFYYVDKSNICRDSNTLKEMIYYRELHGNYDSWLRSREDFQSMITYNGVKTKRFVWIKPF